MQLCKITAVNLKPIPGFSKRYWISKQFFCLEVITELDAYTMFLIKGLVFWGRWHHDSREIPLEVFYVAKAVEKFVPHVSKELVMSDPLCIGHIALSCVTAMLSCSWAFVAGWSQRQWRGCGRAGGCWRRFCGAVQRCPRDTNPPLPRTLLSREMQVGWWHFGTFAWWEIMCLDNFANLSVKSVN